MDVTFVSLDGRLLRANKSLCEMLGYSEEELREISFQTVTHPDELSPEEIPEIAAEVLSASNRIAAIVKRLRHVTDLKSVDYLGDKKMLDLSSDSLKTRTTS
jgi:PAS domain S-box-containing protein